jgi:hypothetical protein
MEIIRDALKCVECQEFLAEPVILPCGQLICSKHVNLEENKGFYCPVCKLNHSLFAKNVCPFGFPRLKAVEKLISAKIDKCEFSTEYENAFRVCKQLEQALFDFDALRNDPYNHIYEVIRDVKNEVDVHVEMEKLKLSDELVTKGDNTLLNEVIEFENECKVHLKSNEFANMSKEFDGKLKKIRLDLING